MLTGYGEDISKWNEDAQRNRFCIENDCPYYFPEIEQCMYGEPDIPVMDKKCDKHKNLIGKETE